MLPLPPENSLQDDATPVPLPPRARRPEKGASSASAPKNPSGWLPPLWREVVAVLVLLLALFVGAALALGEDQLHLIGPVGFRLGQVLRFLLGTVAFLIPVALVGAALGLFLGRKPSLTPGRAVGGLMLLTAITGFMALPQADSEDPALREAAFTRAGALGTFLVEWDGLRLVGAFGMLGAGMILAAVALVGVILLTQRQLSHLVEEHLRPVGAPQAVAAGAAGTLFPRGVALPTAGEEIDEPEPPRRVRREKRTARLAEPDPTESQEVPLVEPAPVPSAAPRAAFGTSLTAEEARIDEEYERALAEESKQSIRTAVKPAPALITLPTEDDEPAPARRILKGNPANDALPPWEDAGGDDEEADQAPEEAPLTNAAPAVADALAKLFPNRYPARTEAEQRDKAEERALRRAATPPAADAALPRPGLAKAAPAAAAPALDPLADLLPAPSGAQPQNDPLFDATLDTRPAGVQAAIEASRRSAVESEESSAQRRNRQLAQYRLPDIQLLEEPPRVEHRMTREEVMEISQLLEKTFADFSIEVKVTEVKQGPVVTRFELKPAAGVKVSRIVSLEHDIAMAMRAISVRIVAPIPGKAAVGIEIPNRNRQGVYLKELVGCQEFWDHPSPLAFALGKTIEGIPNFADLKKMPHLLIAGATGAGKSVCLNTIICSFLYRQRPDRLRLLMIDPKRVELSIYQDIPHLISPVVCDAKRAAAALAWAVEQMEERYKKLVEFNVRNIDGYNEIANNPEKQAKFRGRNMDPMPHMVIIVDEFADLMVVAKAEVEESIQRLAQMARAVGIHLILATQRPSVNVITGIIKANFPTRIAFQVSQKVDSRTILDSNGAETLLGRGDMLFALPGAQKPLRVQGAFLSDEEVERIVNHCRSMAEPMFDVEEFEPLLSEKEQKELAKIAGVTNINDEDDLAFADRLARGTNKTMGKVSEGLFVPHGGGSAGAGDDEIDEALVRAAARTILEARKGSTSLVQRRLKVGFARAGRLMDMLEQMGIVGAYKGSKPRDILVDCDAALAQLDALEAKAAAAAPAKPASRPAQRAEDLTDEDDFADDEEDLEDRDGDDEDDPSLDDLLPERK